MAIGGCNNNEGLLSEAEAWSQERIPQATAQVNQLIAEYGNYDVEQVGLLLAGEDLFWSRSSSFAYDPNGEYIVRVYQLDGEYQPLGEEVIDRYLTCRQFFTDGGGYNGVEGGYGLLPTPITWHFDPETRTIEITDSNQTSERYHLVALGDEVLMLDDHSQEEYRRYLYKPLSGARWECSACGSLHASGRELRACEGASDKE